MRDAMTAMMLGVLATACATYHTAPHGREGAYMVEAFFADVEETHFQELDLSWETDSGGSISSLSSRQSKDVLDAIFASKRNRVVMFPVVYIDPGQSGRIDMQRPVTYPAAFNDDGSVKEEETRGVGQLIEVSIQTKEDGTLHLSYRIEETALVSWISHTVGTENCKVDQPVFSSRAIGSRILVDTLGQWNLTGGFIRTREDGARTHVLSGIRVQENQ